MQRSPWCDEMRGICTCAKQLAYATVITEHSLLDRFPATPAGHIAFLEFVRDEVHVTAEAKRQQLERGYSNATIANMVDGIKWAEARQRLIAIPNVSERLRSDVSNLLQRELTSGTVEQIDNLLMPAIRDLRSNHDYPACPAIVHGRSFCLDSVVLS